jgi:hypothetical protein
LCNEKKDNQTTESYVHESETRCDYIQMAIPIHLRVELGHFDAVGRLDLE